MEIDIIQNKFNLIRDKYDILIDNNLTYKAQSVILSFTSKIELLDIENNSIGFVERQFNFPKVNFPSYDLCFGQYSTIRLITESFIHYKLHVYNGIIDICDQEGRKLGVFLNGKQVGLIDKNKKVVFGADKYKILINDKEISKELIIAFTLAYDDFYYNNRDSIINFDFGNIAIKPDMIIDPNWRP